MINCSDFLREYSDYRDGLMDPVTRAAMEAHLDDCLGCQRYDRVVDQGVSTLRSVPEISPSYDFLPRLQHRIYNLDGLQSASGRPDASATSPAFLLLVIVLIGAAAWLPLAARTVPATVQLPPVVASGPESPGTVHTLFREGPLLTKPPERAAFARESVNTVFFRYTPLGSRVMVRTATLQPR